MECSYEGFVLDPSKCSKLSMDEKRELVYEISKWSQGAPEMLQSWTRRELLQILCAELGKERKYTGLAKIKLIEHLLKIVSKKSENHMYGMESDSQPSSANTQSASKRQRKMDHPSRLAIEKNHSQPTNDSECLDDVIYCQNSACRATIRPEDAFCKRCSCCICFRYDDNKDPSLWLVCNSEPPYQGVSCGMSCHLECALKHEKAGISEGGDCLQLDGSFYCISCGKVNDLLGCLRKQLMVAKGARRVDILCHRVFLSHKLLQRTEKYQELLEIVDTTVKKLEAEVGILDGLPIKMARGGIVNRLSSGAEIQKLCTSAVEMLDTILSAASQPSAGGNIQEASSVSSSMVSSIDVSATSLTVFLSSENAFSEELVRYSLWHRKADTDYPAEPTCTLLRPHSKFSVSNLAPATEYMFKIIFFRETRELGKCEVSFRTSSVREEVTKSWTVPEGSPKGPQCTSPKTNCSGLSNPSSEGDESNSPGNCSSYCEKTSMPSLGKVSEYAHKEISRSENTGAGICCGTDAIEQEEMLGDSVSALDEEHVAGEVASEPNSTIPSESQRDSTNSTNENHASDIPKPDKNNQSGVPLEEISTDNETNTPVGNGSEMVIVPYRCAESVPPTPCKLEVAKDGSGWGTRTKSGSGEPPEKWPRKPEEPQAGSSSKKRSIGRCEDACNGDGSLEMNFEYCVKVIRWLECEGHIQKSFRVKFLTWFSLYATPQERRIVSVYVDTLLDDPASLAGQLVDTFSEGICRKRPPPVPTGFCMKLWH
eukprot:TRINITY_DN565_c0_g1_i2.p1 TRINITY_DN565_c0_g1~~TRINITY_DN565_c0_g1_i2.p1  ORF type:complete len:767 (-),score=163.88 TRINITY_DN565_c0_g1_i2:3937-6237(-)